MRKGSSWLSSVLTVAAALSVASCQQAPSSSVAPAPRAHPGPLWDEPQFTTMLQAYGGKLHPGSRAVRFEMTEGGATLQTQDPVHLAQVVSYDYQGGVLRGPSPVDLKGVLVDPNLGDNLFDWDQVHAERIPALVKQALTQTKLAGARVVGVKVTRKAASSEDMARRIGMLVEARRRALERKLARLEQDPVAGGEPDGKSAPDPSVVAPLDAVEISVLLQAPGGYGWLTADARGVITGSGVDEHEKGPPADIRRDDTARPYWRRAAGLHP